MRFSRALLAAPMLATVLAIAFTLPGCGVSTNHTHEGKLLDNDVLQQRVQSALRRNGTDFQNIHVQAQQGTIILTGTAPSEDASAHAENISRSVYGVKDVQNQIDVKP